jgi:hypothetical protein
MVTAKEAREMLPISLAQAGESERADRNRALQELLKGKDLAAAEAKAEAEKIKYDKEREYTFQQDEIKNTLAQNKYELDKKNTELNRSNSATARAEKAEAKMSAEQERALGRYGEKTKDIAGMYDTAKKLHEDVGFGVDPKNMTEEQKKNLASFDAPSQRLGRFLKGVPLLSGPAQYIAKSNMGDPQRQVQSYTNDVIRKAAGVAVTITEGERVAMELADTPGATSEDIKRAFEAATAVNDRILKQQGLGLNPRRGDYEEVEYRKGVRPDAFEKLNQTTSKQAVETPRQKLERLRNQKAPKGNS